MMEGNYEAAFGHLQEAIAIEGSPSSVLRSYFGLVYGRMGEYDRALPTTHVRSTLATRPLTG